MATKQTKVTQLLEHPPQAGEISLTHLPAAPVFEPEEEPEPSDIAISNLLAELGASDAEVMVRVYRQGKSYREQTFLYECPPDEFSLTRLQGEPYNGGKFRIIARSKNGIAMNQSVDVERLPGVTVPVASVAPDLSPMTEMLATMQANTERLIMALAQNREPQKTTLDMLNEMRLMRDVMGVNDRPNQSPLEVLTLAKELATMINPGEGGADGMGVMMKLLDTFGKPIADIVSQMPNAPQLNALPSPAPETVQYVPGAPKPVLPAQPQSELNEMQMMLKMGVAQLVNQAKRNADPVLYADVIYDQAGDNIVPLLNDPDWFKNLCEINKDAANYPEWFAQVREAILNPPDDHLLTEQKPTVITPSKPVKPAKGKSVSNGKNANNGNADGNPAGSGGD